MSRNPRDELSGAVQYGRMKPEEAEAKLKELGLPPLARQPDPDKFNPMGEVWWTLPMTVSWIAWRSHEDVRSVWDDYRLGCSDWNYREWRVGFEGPVYRGHFLETRKTVTISDLQLLENFRASQGTLSADAMGVREAIKRLWRRLGENALQATGKTKAGERIVIPDYEWRDLEDFEEQGRDVVRVRDGGLVSNRGYDNLAFRRQNIMALWMPGQLGRENLNLPPVMTPDGPGYRPLFCAAHWIATRGGVLEIEPLNQETWREAYSDLLAHIASENVVVTGMGATQREKLDGYLFAGIRVSYPIFDTPIELMLGEELYLSSYLYVDDEHWHGGFDDSLDDRTGRKWTKLLVHKPDVAKWWRFNSGRGQAHISKGAPGRPTSMHLIKLEYGARWERGEVVKSIGAESDHLAGWLTKMHPEAPPLSPKAIRNNLSSEHRQRWAARK